MCDGDRPTHCWCQRRVRSIVRASRNSSLIEIRQNFAYTFFLVAVPVSATGRRANSEGDGGSGKANVSMSPTDALVEVMLLPMTANTAGNDGESLGLHKREST